MSSRAATGMAVATAIVSKAIATTLTHRPMVSRRFETAGAATVGPAVSETVMGSVHHFKPG